MIQKFFKDDNPTMVIHDDNIDSTITIKLINDTLYIYYGDPKINYIPIPKKELVDFINECTLNADIIYHNKLKEELKEIDTKRETLLDTIRSVCTHDNIKNEDYHNDSGYDCNGWNKDSGGWSTCMKCGKHWDWLKDGKPYVKK
jgi:hypothetical protein